MQSADSTMPGKTQRTTKVTVGDSVDDAGSSHIEHVNPNEGDDTLDVHSYNDEEQDVSDSEIGDPSSSEDEEDDEELMDEGVEEPEHDDDDEEEEQAAADDESEVDVDEMDEDEEADDDDDDDDEDDVDEDADEDDDEGSSAGKKTKKVIKMRSGGRKAGKKPEQAEEDEEVQYGIESDEEADDEELQKFEEGTRHQYLLDFHPEALAVDFEEVRALCTVVRDSKGTIIDPLHRTIPVLTKYEKARILGLRAKQLNSNMPSTLEQVPDYIVDGYTIAEAELKNKLIPFIIRRPLPNGSSEYWRVNDLEVLY